MDLKTFKRHMTSRKVMNILTNNTVRTFVQYDRTTNKVTTKEYVSLTPLKHIEQVQDADELFKSMTAYSVQEYIR